MDEIREADTVLGEKPLEKGPFGGPSIRWDYNIKLNLKEIVWEVVDWIQLAQD
jgi:hypothetical protein